jgi:hypothetical protein
VKVSALIPYRAGDEYRDRAWAWLRERWTTYYSEVELIVADDHQEPFSRAASLNDAYAKASEDVIVLADADVLIGPNQLDIAVEWAAKEPGLVFAFTRYIYLREEPSTWLVSTEEPTAWPDLQPSTMEWTTLSCLSAFVVLSRETWEVAGGFDPRFRGWGFEDTAFACAVRALTGHSDRRVPGDLLHLWHPPAWGRDEATYTPNEDLALRYERAQHDPEAIRELIAECEKAWTETSPAAP